MKLLLIVSQTDEGIVATDLFKAQDECLEKWLDDHGFDCVTDDDCPPGVNLVAANPQGEHAIVIDLPIRALKLNI